MTKIAPMTAAEARKLVVWPYGTSERILAALEEREAMLGEREAWKAGGGGWSCSHCGRKWFYGNEASRVITGENAKKHELVCDKNPLKSDASVGALVEKIKAHPMSRKAAPCVVYDHATAGKWFVELDRGGLDSVLSHLDSLLPKEPEVVVKLGGRTWTFGKSPSGNTNVWWRPGDGTATVVASGELELALNALNALGGPNAH